MRTMTCFLDRPFVVMLIPWFTMAFDDLLYIVDSLCLKGWEGFLNLKDFLSVADWFGSLGIRILQICFSWRGFLYLEVLGYFVNLLRGFSRD